MLIWHRVALGVFAVATTGAVAQWVGLCEKEGPHHSCCSFAGVNGDGWCTVGDNTVFCGDFVQRDDSVWQLVNATEGFAGQDLFFAYCEYKDAECDPDTGCSWSMAITRHTCQGQDGTGVCGRSRTLNRAGR